MAIPTVAEIIAEIQDLLGDPDKKVISDAIATRGYQRAYRRLRSAMLNRQLPYAERIATYTLAANATSLTPATASIADFGELVRMEERAGSTSDKFSRVEEVEELPQRDAGSSLGVVEWRGDAWYFVGATGARELRITYLENGEPPASGPVGIDGSLPFLSHYGAAVAGPTKGYVEESRDLMAQAVGAEIDNGVITAGMLLELLRPMVRSLQRTPIQAPAYGVGRTWTKKVAAPYIEAPLPEGSLTRLTITGTQDGENAVFQLSRTPVNAVLIIRDGITLKEGVGFTRTGATVTFLPDYIPQAATVLDALA